MQGTSGEKLGVIIRNPWLVKAGIPLILSATAFITAKILSNRSSPVYPVSDSPAMENETDAVEILEELKMREYELEKRFFMYQDMKERESTAMEVWSKTCVEMTRLEFLGREASLVEAEAKRMEKLMVEYFRVVKKLEISRKKERKLMKRVGEKSTAVKQLSLCIKARDEEMARNQGELERQSEVAVKLENEVRLIKDLVDQLQEEKIELLNKLEMVERLASTKPETGEYDKVMDELQQKEKNHIEMENEITHLRWSNACLRHQLKIYQEHPTNDLEDAKKNNQLKLESSPRKERKLQELFDEDECDGSGSRSSTPLVNDIDNEGSCSTENETFSRRKRFARKLRKWVAGGRKIDEKHKHEEMIKCFGIHSVAHSEEAYDNFVHRKNSFSSV